MVEKAYAFSARHPAAILGYGEVMARLAERLARARALAEQQESGAMAGDAWVVKKNVLRRTIHDGYLVHIVRIARAALHDDPALRQRFRLPRHGLSAQAFVAMVRAIQIEAASLRPVFITDGMSEHFVEELEALLAEYTAAQDHKSLGLARRVGAVAGLPAETGHLMRLVARLDAINRLRWWQDPEMLAAWESVRDVRWARRPQPWPELPAGATGSTG